MEFDPAWDMPELNWKQRGSFEGGSIPSVVEPDAGTQVWLGPVAREQLPWVCGCLDQGRNPSSWIVADDSAMYETLRRWDTLLGLLCGNGGSEMPVMLRFEGCDLQTSIDGGTTWVTIPGWAENFSGCVRSNMPPPVPPNPNHDVVQQHACNIAGYIAHEIIQLSMARMVSGITFMDPEVKIVRDILDLLPGASLALDTLTTSISDFYNIVTGGTLSHYSDASTDGALWSAVTCAIYNVIKVSGYVTAANFAAVFVAINAVTYVHAEVVNAIAFYFATMGLPAVQAMQTVGAIDNIDCVGCGISCFQWDFANGAGPWTVNGGCGSDGSYNGTTKRFESGLAANTCLPASSVLWLEQTFATPIHFAGAVWEFGAGDVSPLGSRRIQGYLGATLVFNITDAIMGAATFPALDSVTTSGIIDKLIFFMDVGFPSLYSISRIAVDFNGPNPFGADNCTI